VLELIHKVIQELIMNKIQQLARKSSQQEESIRFSVSLIQSDNARLEDCAEIKGMSKSAFCSELLTAALDVFEEALGNPDDSCNEFLPPSAEKYSKAFEIIKSRLTNRHRSFLKAHYQSAQHTSTASELAEAADYQSYKGYNLQSAKVGRMLAGQLGISIPQRHDGSPLPSGILVKWWKDTEDCWYCTLHPEVAIALEIVGLT
jgi:predicted HTH domain antitoxin